LDTTISTEGSTPATWQGRHSRARSSLWEKQVAQKDGKDGSVESGEWASKEEDKEEMRRQREERGLEEASSELKSLSIDHWSLEDVVAFEPMPGGRKPPAVPSTTTADPDYMMPQSPWASDNLKRQNYARVWTRKKIAKMETAIARFAVRACSLLELHSQWPSNLIVLPEAIRPIAKQTLDQQRGLERMLSYRMKILRNRLGDVPQNEPPEPQDELLLFMPKYDHFEDGLHHEFLRDLNTSLVELFDGYKRQQLDFRALMLKVCHNLLVSSAPPNVQTMNILMLGFYSCDKFLKVTSSQLRHLILDWLIEICFAVKIRPNEVTCSTILATYRRRGMRHTFAHFIMLMRGMGNSHALMYTKELTRTRESAPRLTPTESDPLIFKQAVYPSPMIFAEVIKGVAKFYTLEDAVTICKDFTAKEWGYDWSCLHYLLNACIIQKDWQSGLWVWEEIKAFRAAGHAEPIRILATMLALCVQCQRTEMFAEVLEYSTGQLKNINAPAFVDIATEILERAVERIDDDDLFAMTNDHDETGADDAGQETRTAERTVRRRLKDDPTFRLALFGFGSHVRAVEDTKERNARYLDLESMGEDYRYRSLKIGGRAFEPDDENEILEATEVDQPSRFDKSDQQDLLSQARGGDDMEESEASTMADLHISGDKGEGFGSFPMDLGDDVRRDTNM
jgi:hypothetical protein